MDNYKAGTGVIRNSLGNRMLLLPPGLWSALPHQGQVQSGGGEARDRGAPKPTNKQIKTKPESEEQQTLSNQDT